MGKKSRRAGRNKPKRSEDEILLAELELPIPLPIDAATPPRDNRQLADYCLKNVSLFEKHDEMRFCLLGGYLTLVQNIFDQAGREDAWCKRHVKFLRKTADDDDEFTYVRVESFFPLSLVYCRKRNFEGVVDCMEKVVVLCKNASEVEKSRRLPNGLLVSESLAEQQRRAEKFIDEGYNEYLFSVVRSPTETVQVSLSAGNQCDNCQKTKAELNVDRFRCCTRCQFEYYCSPECQRSAWKNGHKLQCRAKGQYHVGDQAIHFSQETEEQVRLVEYVEMEDSWVVTDIYGKNQCTVLSKELIRLRPAFWNYV